MLLSYVGVFMAVAPAVVGTTFSGCLSRVSGPTSPRPCTAPPEASPPFRQSLLSIARGTAPSDAPRMRRRPVHFVHANFRVVVFRQQDFELQGARFTFQACLVRQ